MTAKSLFSTVLLHRWVPVLLVWPFVVFAQATYPTKPIRWIVPFPPGGRRLLSRA